MAAKRVGQGGLAVVLMLATGVPPMLTAGVSILSPLIRNAIGISRAEFGLFAVVLFSVTAALSIPVGRLSDRVPFMVGLTTTYISIVLGLLVAASAQHLWALLLAAVLGAVGLAIVGPVTNRMVGVLGRSSRQGALLATKQAGVQVGQVAASLICSVFVGLLSWRAGLASMAVVALVVLVPTILWVMCTDIRNVPRTWTDSIPIMVPATNRPVLMITVLSAYSFFSGIVYQGVIFGLPVFAHEIFGLSVNAAGISLAVVGGLGFISRIALGPLMDRIRRVRGTMIAVAVIALLGTSLLAFAALTLQPWALWTGASIYGLASTAANVLCSIAVIRYFKLANVGFITGIVMVSTFAGFAIGPMTFGLIVDMQGHRAAWMVFAIVTALTCVVPLALRRPRRSHDRAFG